MYPFIWGQIVWCGGVSTSKKDFLSIITIQFQIEVSLRIMITRNESFNRNSSFSYKVAVEMLHCDTMHRILTETLPLYLFTLTITNFTLIKYYLHYVNSSPMNRKQYRFVSEETEQKVINNQ